MDVCVCVCLEVQFISIFFHISPSVCLAVYVVIDSLTILYFAVSQSSPVPLPSQAVLCPFAFLHSPIIQGETYDSAPYDMLH